MQVNKRPSAPMLLRRLLAALGATGLAGTAIPASATAPPARQALEARVAQVRADLQARDADAQRPVVVAASQWNNWPNWSNWAKWANG